MKPLGESRSLLGPKVADFTVLIKNHVEFPLYNKRRSNILESSNASYLSRCLHDETDAFCPVFKLTTMARLAGEDFNALSVNGAVLAVGIEWDCDLDYDFMRYCRPTYSFRRLDNPKAKIAPGWNFRHVDTFQNGARTLTKVVYANDN